MASTYSDLKIELIGTGEQTGTWGTTTNNNFSIAIGEAITGSADVSFSSADVTVTLTDTNAAQTARNLRLNLTGTSGGARNLILGSGCQIEKLYLINNGLADAVTVKNTSGTGIAVPAGKTMFVYNNGTNVVEAVNSAVTLDVTTLDATNIEVTNIKAKDGTAAGSIANSTGVVTLASSVLTTTDINGGTIDNTAIGGSTAAAGKFTTLEATGVATFSAGAVGTPAITTTGDTNTGIFFPAADTIAFTEGGAESMRIDSSGRVQIGTTTATGSTKLVVADSAGNGQIRAIHSTGSGFNINQATASGEVFLQQQDNAALAFTTNNTERMRISSGGLVGIGLTSYNLPLSVVADANGQNVQLNGRTGDDFGQIFFRNFGGANNLARIASDSNAALIFGTGSQTAPTVPTERMRITSSGDIGIGTTSPAALLNLVKATSVGMQQKGNDDITEASNFFQRQVVSIINYTSWATAISIATSIGGGGYTRCFVKMSAMGHNSGIANGAVIDSIWYIDFNNSAISVAQVSAGTTTGTAPQVRLNVSSTTIEVQVQSSNGTNRFDGMLVAEMNLAYGAGAHPLYTIS